MLGISTCWKSASCKTGEELLNHLIPTGITGLELEYRITEDLYNQFIKIIKKSEFRIFSLHNYCPHPGILPYEQACGDAFMLSATDSQERKLAVQYAKRTIQNAHDLEVDAVVLHLGKVTMERGEAEWYKFFDTGTLFTNEGQQFVRMKLDERQAKQNPHIDAMLQSVDELNEEAIKRNVRLGIENRNHWDSMPNLEELDLIFKTFDGGNVFYWHDCGHAHAYEVFGLAKHEEILKKYAHRLIGIHLHDSNGYHDHIAPGKGEIDFSMIRKYLPENAIRILELHKGVLLEDIIDGVDYLKEKGIC
jgi:sugar phosphate isomerase/epimerase